MTNTPKTWYDGRVGGTRIDAAALNDLEQRLFGRIEERMAEVTGSVDRGEWTADTIYALNDRVMYGSSYLARNTAGTSALSFEADAANWTVLINGTGLLFRAESLSVLSGATSIADLGLSGSFTLDRTRTCMFVFYASAGATSATSSWTVWLTDQSNNVKEVATIGFTGAATLPLMLVQFATLAAGSYTRKIRTSRQSGSGTLSIVGDPATPIHFAGIAF